MAVGTTTTLIRMKTETKARLKEYCANNGITQTDFFIRAIDEKLDGRPIVKISQKLMDRLVAQSDKEGKSEEELLECILNEYLYTRERPIREEKWKLFINEYKDAVQELADFFLWPEDKSLEQFLLPDGPKELPENYCHELQQGLARLQEKYNKVQAEREEAERHLEWRNLLIAQKEEIYKQAKDIWVHAIAMGTLGRTEFPNKTVYELFVLRDGTVTSAPQDGTPGKDYVKILWFTPKQESLNHSDRFTSWWHNKEDIPFLEYAQSNPDHAEEIAYKWAKIVVSEHVSLIDAWYDAAINRRNLGRW